MWPARTLSDLCAGRPRIVITGPPVQALSGIATHVNLLLGSSVCRRFTLAHLYAGGEGLIEGFARRILRRLSTPVRLLTMLVTWHAAILHINTALNARALPLIEHRRTGLLVPPRRPDLLADAILQLAHDRLLLERISRAARERICDSHDLAGMAARFCALYDEILDERRRA